MKIWIPYPSKHGNPIREITEDNITSINNKNKKKEEIRKSLKTVINFYENNMAAITPFVAEDMEKYLKDGIEADLIIACMEEAVSRNIRIWKYVASTLNNCCNKKITTAKQFEISQAEFKSNKTQTEGKKKTEEKVEYEEVHFDNDEEYRKKLFEKQKG